MSNRNTAYQFIELDAEALEREITAKYETLTGGTVRAASPESLFIKWIVSVLIQERAMANDIANQNVPSRATGENLDALGELFFVTSRPEAKPAYCTMRFQISEAQDVAILVPAGTRVTDADQTLFWETVEDAVVPIGETNVETRVNCQTPGAVGNGWKAGSLNTIVDVFDYYTACTNVTQTDGGSDELTDDEYYELMMASLEAYSTAGAVGSYEYHAKLVNSEISSVVVTSPSACEVRIFALMEDGTPASSEIKAEILAACNAENVRPLTDHVLVDDPAAETYNIDLTYWLPSGGDASAIADAITAAVDDYAAWQGSKLGRNINPSKLMSLVMQAGAARVEIREPVFTVLRNGSEPAPQQTENSESEEESDPVNTAPQYAALGNTTIVNGGYEDG